MNNRHQATPTAQRVDLRAQMHLAEYERIQARILESERTQHQVLVLGLGAVSIVIPIFLGQATYLPPSVIAALLYALAIVFAALTTNYVIVNFDLAQATSYIHRYLAPELNRIAATHSEHQVMDFERRQRLVRRKPVGLFLANIGSLSAEIVLLLPAFLSMGAARYVLLLPAVLATPSQTAPRQLVESWLGPLATIAWVSLILTVLTFIGCTVYWITSGYLADQ